MSTADHERYEQDVGAYLLGALPALEAEVYERHLMGCEACQRELERLRPAADALPRSVEPFDPPPSLKRSLMEVVESEARAAPAAHHARPARVERGSRTPFYARAVGAFAGLRPRVAVALASVALLAGVALGLGLAQGGGEDATTVTASVDRARLPGAAARVEIADAEGRPATLHVSGVPLPPRGQVYEVWVERDGEVRPAGALFEPGRDGSGSAAIPDGVEGVDRVMVTREAAGGADRPTEAPVIAADV
jgi:anti-sigma factor RsiW